MAEAPRERGQTEGARQSQPGLAEPQQVRGWGFVQGARGVGGWSAGEVPGQIQRLKTNKWNCLPLSHYLGFSCH